MTLNRDSPLKPYLSLILPIHPHPSPQVYNPGSGWSSLPAMQQVRDNAMGAAINGKFYVFGGRSMRTTPTLP